VRNVLRAAPACELRGYVRGQFLLVFLVLLRGFRLAMLLAHHVHVIIELTTPSPTVPGVGLSAQKNCRAFEIFVFAWSSSWFRWPAWWMEATKREQRRVIWRPNPRCVEPL